MKMCCLKIKKNIIGSIVFLFAHCILFAQADSNKWDIHYQLTTVTQWHNDLNVPYEGANSLHAAENDATSLTTTLFLTYKPFKNMSLVFNPEIAGGKGLSSAMGLGGFSNGECFRIGNPTPTPYIARLLVEYHIPLNKKNISTELQEENYIKFFAGKFSLMDYVEKSIYSQDPRTQFMNWTFMTSGGWDYAANTRGYIVGAGMQLKYKKNTYSLIATQLPLQANGLDLDDQITKAFALQFSLRRDFTIGVYNAMIEGIVFFNKANMGNYNEAVKNIYTTRPDITTTRNYNNTKYGGLINTYFSFSNTFGIFAKASWNDGNNETWAFTEIDHSAVAGFVKKFIKPFLFEIGSGYAFNGLSEPHKNYLKAGGLGFMIGDGALNYSLEHIWENYIKITLWKNQLELSPHYQFIVNPAYNKDRGIVHIWGIRTHLAF